MSFIFIDVACKTNMGSIAGLLIIEGSPQMCWDKKLDGAYSPEEAEAATLLQAFLKVKQHQLTNVTICIDFSIVLQSYQNKK